MDFLMELLEGAQEITSDTFIKRIKFQGAIPALILQNKILRQYFIEVLEVSGYSLENQISNITHVDVNLPENDSVKIHNLFNLCNDFKLYIAICRNFYSFTSFKNVVYVDMYQEPIYLVTQELLEVLLKFQSLSSVQFFSVIRLQNSSNDCQKLLLYVKCSRKLNEFSEIDVLSFLYNDQVVLQNPSAMNLFNATQLHFNNYVGKAECTNVIVSNYPSQKIDGTNCYYCLHCVYSIISQFIDDISSQTEFNVEQFENYIVAFAGLQNINLFLSSIIRNTRGHLYKVKMLIAILVTQLYDAKTLFKRITGIKYISEYPQTVDLQILKSYWQNDIIDQVTANLIGRPSSHQKVISVNRSTFLQYNFLQKIYQRGPTMIIAHSAICPNYVIELYSTPWKSCSANFHTIKRFQQIYIVVEFTETNLKILTTNYQQFQICVFIQIGFHDKLQQSQLFSQYLTYGVLIPKPCTNDYIKSIVQYQFQNDILYVKDQNIKLLLNGLNLEETIIGPQIDTSDKNQECKCICLGLCDEQQPSKYLFKSGQYFDTKYCRFCLPCIDYFLKVVCKRSMKNEMEGISFQLDENQNLASIIDSLFRSGITESTLNNFLVQILTNNSYLINLKYCPQHPYLPAVQTEGGLKYQCFMCNMFYCLECHNWHTSEKPCFSIKACCNCNSVIYIQTNQAKVQCPVCQLSIAAHKLIEPKRCPVCQVVTDKYAGCNHITCFRCNSHWCYACEKQFSYQNIYKHMSQAHGGWY